MYYVIRNNWCGRSLYTDKADCEELAIVDNLGLWDGTSIPEDDVLYSSENLKNVYCTLVNLSKKDMWYVYCRPDKSKFKTIHKFDDPECPLVFTGFLADCRAFLGESNHANTLDVSALSKEQFNMLMDVMKAFKEENVLDTPVGKYISRYVGRDRDLIREAIFWLSDELLEASKDWNPNESDLSGALKRLGVTDLRD